MARRSPLLTLLAGGLLGVGLLAASVLATPVQPAGDAAAAADATESPEPPDESPAADDPVDAPEPQAGTEPDATAGPEPDESPEPAPDEPDPVTYVGYVDGGGASVALVVTGDEAVGYVCDGVAVEAWVSGPAVAGRLDLASDDGATLTGTFDDAEATGETVAGDLSWTFTVEQVDPPEGLYRFADTIVGGAEVVGGWIVLPDGTQVGVVNVDGDPAPAEELDVGTGEVSVDGVTVTAELLPGGDRG